MNDSTVCEVRFNKLRRRLTAVQYKRKEFYSAGYARPLAVLKFKMNKPVMDTTLVENEFTELVYSIKKHYTGILIDSVANADQSNR